jgi:chromosomal replication initiation ATPase DnaA
MNYKAISEEIKEKLNVDVFENSRRQNVVDARSLFCYILRKDFHLTLYTIVDVFKSNGKEFSHCSVLHNVNTFEIARKIDYRLDEIRNGILRTANPKAVLINRVREIYDLDRIKGLNNLIDFQEQQIK